MNTVQPHPEWKILVQEFSNSDYGTFVSHAQVEKLIGFGRSHKLYYRTTQRWKKAMRKDHSRAIEIVWDEGYRLVEPDQYRASTKRQFSLAKKRVAIGVEIAAIAPIELMSDGEKPRMIEYTRQIETLAYFMEDFQKKTMKLQKEPPPKLSVVAGNALDVAD